MLLNITGNSKFSILLTMIKEKEDITSNFFIKEFVYA